MSFKDYIKFAFKSTIHPFDCFWDIKHEKKGNFITAFSILVMLIFVLLMKMQFTGFLFNNTEKQGIDLFKTILAVAIPFMLWCTSNWCVTTLFDGKGTFKDVFITSAYALIPIMILTVPQILISNILILRETQIYLLIESIAILWTAFLLFFGIMTIHDFTIAKTVITVTAALLSCAIIIFLVTIFFSLVQQLLNFISVIIKEILMRFK